MSPSAIYSKSGKGVQEASGKTSLLKRADRAVLSAIDGRANLGEVAQKVGKPFDAAFQALIHQLDKDGFVRELAAANVKAAPKPAPKPAAPVSRAPAKAPSAAGGGDDLDFTGILTTPMRKAPVDEVASKRAKEQEAALYKARQEAEARAQEERERARLEIEGRTRAEAEARIRAETEKKLRGEAEAKAKALAEAKAKAAREAALRMAQEAKARLEAEAKVKIEAERRAREEAERKAKEEAEQARREAEELRQRLEEERKAREEAERKAREAEERRRREEEALRQEQEAQMRRAREEAERKRAEVARLEAEGLEAERRERREAEAREAREAETRRVETKPAGGLDALMADLDSFSSRDDDERKAREAAEGKAREEKQRVLREEADQLEREAAAREQAERERRAQEEEERRAREDEERRAREEEERARAEAEERERSALEVLAARQALEQSDDIGVTEEDLGMDDVRRDEAAVPQESRKARREREREAKQLEKEARARDRAAAKAAKAAAKAEAGAETVRYSPPRRPRRWGRRVAVSLFLLLAAGIGLLHVIPVPTGEFERAASEALRQPVRIGSARLSLFTGVRLNLAGVSVGKSTKVAAARAYPRLGSLFDEVKAFSRIELDGVTLAQRDVGEALLARANGPKFVVNRVLVRDLRLAGPAPLPVLEVDVRIGPDGKVRTALLRGPEGLMGQLMPRTDSVEFELTAASLTLPFAPDVALGSFAMKGEATRQGMRIQSWGGSLLGGALSGSANLRWGGTWQVDGVVRARNVNAAVFAPALLSEGSVEGSGKFSMSGAEPAKLLRGGRVEGRFTIGKGVLGSFDLARAIRTRGEEVNGRTQFVELNGQGSYDGGVVALRNVTIGAGALQAGASADISQSGALSGHIVADVRTASRSLRATLNLGGTVKEPQVRN